MAMRAREVKIATQNCHIMSEGTDRAFQTVFSKFENKKRQLKADFLIVAPINETLFVFSIIH